MHLPSDLVLMQHLVNNSPSKPKPQIRIYLLI